jgi:hypothetical protein
MPLARYSTINGALASGSKPPSYTTSWDTTSARSNNFANASAPNVASCRAKAALSSHRYP